MKKVRLSDIPGIGPKTEQKLIVYFGSEEEALKALEKQAIGLISEALGSYKKALRLVQNYIALSYGVEVGEVFGTRIVSEIFKKYLETIADLAVSRPARERISTIFPLPARAATYIIKKLEELKEAFRVYDELNKNNMVDTVRVCLKKLDWPKNPRFKFERRTLVVPTFRSINLKLSGEIKNYIEVVEVRDEIELERIIRERGPVFVYGLEIADVPGAIVVNELSQETLFPENIIVWYEANRGLIEAILCVLETLKGIASRILDTDNLETLKHLLEYSLKFTVKGPTEGANSTFDNLRKRYAKIEEIVYDVATWATEEVKRRLERLEVKLTGLQLLKLIEEFSAKGQLVVGQFEEIVREVVEEAENKVVEGLGLDIDEAESVVGLFRVSDDLSIEVDEDKLRELKKKLELKIETLRLKLLIEAAKQLKNLKPIVENMFDKLVELDVRLALALFAKKYGGCIPEFSTDYIGVGFVGAAEIELLKHSVNIQRISYSVGNVPYKPDSVKGERIVILTGANSGGKTTLLKTVAEVVLAAQAGLPVIAERAWIGGFDRIYFFEKPAGTLSAGALESTLKSMANIVVDKSRRLVLVDELESVTEARAAAKIVAGFVEMLVFDNNAVAIIVSHLAEDILEILPLSLRKLVRVDGIEARGLDENYNLIVDRNPRYYYLARSTPELVIARLVVKSSSEERSFFEKLLKLFK